MKELREVLSRYAEVYPWVPGGMIPVSSARDHVRNVGDNEPLLTELESLVRAREKMVQTMADVIVRTIPDHHKDAEAITDECAREAWCRGYIMGAAEAAARIRAMPLPCEENLP